jgi:predicted phosphodiesterase
MMVATRRREAGDAVPELTFTTPFAVFSDVHGNLPALEAVLADIDRRGLPAVCLGDLVGYGPWPDEVAALVRERRIPCLMGNYDRGIGFATGDCGCVYRTDAQRAEGAASLAFTEARVSEETRAFLRSLADRFVIRTPNGEVLAVHGSPRRINEYLFADRPDSSLARLAAQGPWRAILFGHTHQPWARDVARPGDGGRTLFVNVGSAGRPRDGDWRACYAVLDPSRLAEGPAAVAFARVPYDYGRLQEALARTSLITKFTSPHEGAPADDH